MLAPYLNTTLRHLTIPSSGQVLANSTLVAARGLLASEDYPQVTCQLKIRRSWRLRSSVEEVVSRKTPTYIPPTNTTVPSQYHHGRHGPHGTPPHPQASRPSHQGQVHNLGHEPQVFLWPIQGVETFPPRHRNQTDMEKLC